MSTRPGLYSGMSKILRAGQVMVLPPELLELLGSDGEPMEALAARARTMFPAAPPIVWECDACSFQFAFVSDAAVPVLGYPSERWLEPMFWTTRIVCDEDRDDAVTYCELATAKARDHMFEYRARAADGRIVWLRDYVKVVPDGRGRALRLRGVMFDVTSEKVAEAAPVPARTPTRAELAA